VVGDDAQAIYGFRGATVQNILQFPQDFPGAEVVRLEQNYRSTEPLLALSNAVMAAAEEGFPKTLWSNRPAKLLPRLVRVFDEDEQNAWIIEDVLARVEEGIPLKQQAILFRTSHHSDLREDELNRRNIPYHKYGGLKFLEAAHVKDVLSILKWADNPKNEVAAFRVLKLLHGMGPASAAKCYEYLALHDFKLSALGGFVPPSPARAEWAAFAELMQSVAVVPGEDESWQTGLAAVRRWYRPILERLYDSIETREADIEQLEQIAGRYATRERFLTELTLDPPSAAGTESGDPLLDEDYLVLSTVHSAKGQEWDAVFVLNVTDGSFPSEFSTGKAELIEEERRLMYVAMTRAKQSLTLCAPLRFHVTRQPPDGDRHVFGARSRFMTDRLLATMRTEFRGRDAAESNGLRSRSSTRIDVGARMREMW